MNHPALPVGNTSSQEVLEILRLNGNAIILPPAFVSCSVLDAKVQGAVQACIVLKACIKDDRVS